MHREEAIATGGMWSGLLRTEAGLNSGWHHHGDYESSIYVISGTVRLEFGPDGAEAVDASAGDFVYVPKGVVHRTRAPVRTAMLMIESAGVNPTGDGGSPAAGHGGGA